MILRDLLRVLGSNRRDGRNLSTEEAYNAFDTILSGTESEIRVGAFLIALRWKGVTVEELTGFARAARARARIPCAEMPGVVCLCPPHDGYERYAPLEVVAGLVAAAVGARVLLIVDRSVPPKRGLTAANVLERLGAGMTWDPTEAEDWIERARFAAIAATGMLPALLGLRRVRGDLGVRTPLATVEKLLAPPKAAIVIGAGGGPVLGTAIQVVQSLGHPRGIVVQGLEGGLVPTVVRRTRGIELNEGRQVPLSIEPGDFGLGGECDAELPLFLPPDEGQGPADNPELVRGSVDQVQSVLCGQTGPARSSVLMSAAVVLKACGRAMTLAEGIDLAGAALDSGAASALLERLRGLARHTR